jgi:hypothetical protein
VLSSWIGSAWSMTRQPEQQSKGEQEMVKGLWKMAAACVFWGLVGYTGSLALVPLACFWMMWGTRDVLRASTGS